jgi:hypothetical protein
MEPTTKEDAIRDKKKTKNESSTAKKESASRNEKAKDMMMTKQQKVMKKNRSHQISIHSVMKSVMFYLIIIM